VAEGSGPQIDIQQMLKDDAQTQQGGASSQDDDALMKSLRESGAAPAK
jgi:hypothetical protein